MFRIRGAVICGRRNNRLPMFVGKQSKWLRRGLLEEINKHEAMMIWALSLFIL